MNYIGHFLCANFLQQSFTGHYLGDYVKGLPSAFSHHYPSDWVEGILFHRKLDAFTDSSPALREIRKMAPTALRRYCGIIIDLAYDHHLASQWEKRTAIFFPNSPQPTFREFCTTIYEQLEITEVNFPEKAAKRFRAMRENDWLSHYVNFSSLEHGLKSISRRLPRSKPLLDGYEFLRGNRGFIDMQMSMFTEELKIYLESIDT